MNRQRKVLITITYNEMGTIIDTKAEEVTQPVEPKTDLVNRSDVLELAKSGVLISNDNYKKVCEAINGLPSCHTCRECEPVEPKPVCEDAISRADAIEAIKCDIIVTGKQNAELVAETIGNFVDAIKSLPAVEPKLPQPHKCVVYRDGSECRYPIEACSECPKHEGMRAVLAQRPKGEWIDREHCQVDEDAYDVAICPNCKAEITLEDPNDNFCPNCGCDCRGDKE